MRPCVLYVLGTESCGKTDLVRQIEHLVKGRLRTVPNSCTPTMGQELTEFTLQSSNGRGEAVFVEVRELGGSLVNTWESFIASRKASDGNATQRTEFLLLYVVDGVAPHQLPLSSTMLRYLTRGEDAACSGWPTLVALQKCTSATSMTRGEVRDFIGDDVSATIMEVDSWNGVGIGAVLQWIRTAALRAPLPEGMTAVGGG